MKFLIKPVILTIALTGASSAFSASSVDLTVKGLITPAACMPLMSNGGLVDHGKISAKDLHPTGNTVLPDASLQLSINCEAATLVAIKGTDNRAGTSAEPSFALPNYGLGLASGDQKIGWYLLKMTNTTADDVLRDVIESADGQTWMDAPANTVWQPNWMRTVNGASNTAPVPLLLTTLKTDVVISTTLRSQRDLPIAEEILIDGSATLDIVYL